MSSSSTDVRLALAQRVVVTDEAIVVDLSDGRTLSVPVDWYPRLTHATRKQRSNWRLIGRGVGIHWPDLDEDVSVEGLLFGRRSSESQRSLAGWLESKRLPEDGRIRATERTRRPRSKRTRRGSARG